MRESFGGRNSLTGRSSIKKVENQDLSSKYDYVLVFKMVGEQKPYKQPDVAKYCVDEMQKAGLETFSYLSVQGDELLVLVRCPVSKTYSSFFYFLYHLNFFMVVKII
jgi:hypothetical protein